MQLIRFELDDRAGPRIGIHTDGTVHDVTARFGSIASFVAAHPDGWTREVVNDAAAACPLREVRLVPPVDTASTLYLVGANYRQHADEAGLSVPKTPVFFAK